jgi:hypothetical protein
MPSPRCTLRVNGAAAFVPTTSNSVFMSSLAVSRIDPRPVSRHHPQLGLRARCLPERSERSGAATASAAWSPTARIPPSASGQPSKTVRSSSRC